MRKRVRCRTGKNKHRCFCKPNKVGMSARWNYKELQDIKQFEKVKREIEL